jgi:hypothetical protein
MKITFPMTRQRLLRNPAAIGLSIGTALLFGLLIQEILLDRFTVVFGPGEVALHEFRIAVIHCLLAGYLPSAYLLLLRGTRNTVHELENVLEPADAASGAGSSIHIGWRALFLAGLIGVLVTVFTPYLTTPTAESPWNPSTWSPEVWWHRVLGPLIGWWLGWFVLAVWDTSARTSRLAARVVSVDLLDLSPLSPFVRQGLLTALLIVGAVSVSSLFLLEPGQWPVVAIVVGLCLPLAMLGLWLPVRGVHRRIQEAKQAELEWTRARIRQSRDHLHDGSSDVSPDEIGDLIVYLRFIEDVPEWPLQTSSIVQVALYLLIPVASWFGSLLIESMLDRLF